MPRYIFPAGSVANTSGAPLRLTFHATNATGRRETDLWSVSGSDLNERIPNGVVLTDASGNYASFAGPDDMDVLYLVPHTGGSRTQITATSMVAGSGNTWLNSTYVPVFGVGNTGWVAK